MKVDGITLLQMIRDGKIKEGQEIKGNGRTYIYNSSTGNLLEKEEYIFATEELEDEDAKYHFAQFTPYQFYRLNYEIVENKGIGKLPTNLFYDMDAHSFKINEIIDKLNKEEETNNE